MLSWEKLLKIVNPSPPQHNKANLPRISCNFEHMSIIFNVRNRGEEV